MNAKVLWMLGAALLVAALFPLHRGWSRPPAPAGTFSSGPGLPGLQPLPAVEQEVQRLTSATRRRHGLPPLTPDPDLAEACRRHSLDMLGRRFFSHQNRDGLSLRDRLPPGCKSRISRAAENIWTCFGPYPPDPRALARMMINSWMSSPGHRQNILTPGFTYLGVGVAASSREVRATMIFVEIR